MTTDTPITCAPSVETPAMTADTQAPAPAADAPPRDPRIRIVADAMCAKRQDLIAQPLSFIWEALAEAALAASPTPSPMPAPVAEHYAYLAERIINLFDKDETAGSFLRDDGDGGFASGVYRMAREIDRLRASPASTPVPTDAHRALGHLYGIADAIEEAHPWKAGDIRQHANTITRALSAPVQSCVTTPLAGEAGADEWAQREAYRKGFEDGGRIERERADFLEEEVERLRAGGEGGAVEALRAFARWALEPSFTGHDLEGSEVQEKAADLGLLVETVYDPEKHGPSDFGEPGMPWFMFGPALDASLTPPKAETERDKAMLRGALWELREYAAMDARDGPAGAVVNVLGQAAYDWLGDRIEAFVADQFSALPAPKAETEADTITDATVADIDADYAVAEEVASRDLYDGSLGPPAPAETASDLERLVEALRELLEACEADCGVPDASDEDDEAVGVSEEGPMALTFGMLRRARAALSTEAGR